MHAQRSSSPEQVDAAVLAILLDDRFELWSIAEVEREIENKTAVADSLVRLQAAGLVHVVDADFVKPSRAARYFDRLELP